MQDGLLGATTARSEITAAVSVTNAESGNWNARKPPVFSPAATARSCTILQTIALRCPERVHDLVVEANRPKRRPCTIGLHPHPRSHILTCHHHNLPNGNNGVYESNRRNQE